MKMLPVLLIAAGIAAMAGLVLHFGAGSVAAALLAVGLAGFASVTLIHTVLIAVMGLAWQVLLPGTKPWVAVWGRFVRDAAAEALPLSQLGGFVFGVRALQLGRVSAIGGALSMSVDLVMELWAKLPYFVAAADERISVGGQSVCRSLDRRFAADQRPRA